MRRWTTALIVVGIAVVGVLAVADALRGDGEPNAASESPTITRAAPPTLREVLRRDAISGFVVYSDDDCRLHSLLLPRLVDDVVRREDGSDFTQCRFTSAGGRILEEGDRMSPDRTLVATCRGGRVVVREAESGAQRRSYRGCPPAWRPDGRLTYPQGDRIMEDDRVLFSATELRGEARRLHPMLAGLDRSIAIFVHATDLAWLDENHLVATLEIRVPDLFEENLAVLFRGKKVVGVAIGRTPGLGKWVVSPAGTFAASESGSILRRDGGSIDPPRSLPPGHAVAFSPDEQWLAYVTNVSIYLIGTPRNTEPGRIIRLPIAAQDLIWEPGGAGATGTTTAAR
jgi:hypothetical protein